MAFNEKAFEAVAAGITGTVVLKGIFTTDNATQNFLPPVSTFTFTKTSTLQHQVLSCYRPPGDPWYLRTVPDWTQFFIVPMFAFVCSLCNFQPASCRSSRIDLAVMTIIGCASYTTNTLVNIYFGYAPLMSTVGAFTVAFMGNGWARATGRSAFGAMVTGVLFLVPVGVDIAFSALPAFLIICNRTAYLRTVASLQTETGSSSARTFFQCLSVSGLGSSSDTYLASLLERKMLGMGSLSDFMRKFFKYNLSYYLASWNSVREQILMSCKCLELSAITDVTMNAHKITWSNDSVASPLSQ